MPKLWKDTIESHRREVHDAIVDATAALVAEHGLLSVTMSLIAAEAGIGRATLYKYFPDVHAILQAWHERQIAAHLKQITEARDRATDPAGRLTAVLETYAVIQQERSRLHRQGPHGAELATFLHQDAHMTAPHHQLHTIMRTALADAAKAGAIRDDVPPDELATYCRHALDAATDLKPRAALHRLVAVTQAGLRPPS